MILVDTRRLTGANHISRAPLVIVEITLEAQERLEAVRAAYAAELGRMRMALGLADDVSLLVRPHVGGGVLAYESPLDTMLACAEMSEWAALSATELLAARAALPLEPKRSEVAAMLEEQKSPRLLELSAEADRRGVPFVWDDETLTLGMGARSASFPIAPRSALPDVGDVPWDALGRIPVALVTGTNGKTTSARLLARIALTAGLHVGCASTGGVTFDGEVVETGDWTGPAAARMVLARKDVELAVLETARGGILRRGLAVSSCDVALITNVSDDHLGLYGIDDVDAMVHVKATIARVVMQKGAAVLCAHEPRFVALARDLRRGGRETIFFADLDAPAQDEARAVIADARAGGHRCVFAQGGLVVTAAGNATTLLRIDEIPLTFGGAAPYNVKNVLGVVAAALALGLPRDAMIRALRAFDMKDNPGRGQLTEHDGVRVLLDFGHNPESVRGVMQLVSRLRDARMPRGKLTVVTGSAGDRPDRELADVCAAIWEARPDRVLVRELSHYLRGRAPLEVPAIFRRELLALGLPDSSFALVDSEVAALRTALADAVPRDFIVVLVHVEEEETRAFLTSPFGKSS